MTGGLLESQKGYFAGLFDGEGTVVISKWYYLSVSFGLTFSDILYKMKRLFGGSIHKKDMTKTANSDFNKKVKDSGLWNPENRKQIYEYHLSGKEAWMFLKIIEPYCEEKREQVKTAIEFFNGKSHRLSKSQIDRCEYYRKRLQELKIRRYVYTENSEIQKQQTIEFFLER